MSPDEQMKLLAAEIAKHILSPQGIKTLAAEVAKQMRWPEVMDIETAAEYISSGYDAVLKMVRKRELPAVGRGTRKFVRRVDLDRWAERNAA